MGPPDYEKAYYFGYNTTYYAASNGWVYNRTYAKGTHTIETIVQGYYFRSQSYDPNAFNEHTHMIPIAKGQWYRVQQTSDQRAFIPCKVYTKGD